MISSLPNTFVANDSLFLLRAGEEGPVLAQWNFGPTLSITLFPRRHSSSFHLGGGGSGRGDGGDSGAVGGDDGSNCGEGGAGGRGGHIRGLG